MQALAFFNPDKRGDDDDDADGEKNANKWTLSPLSVTNVAANNATQSNMNRRLFTILKFFFVK